MSRREKDLIKELKISPEEEEMMWELESKMHDKSLQDLIPDIPPQNIERFLDGLKENRLYGYYTSQEQKKELHWLYSLTKRRYKMQSEEGKDGQN